MSDMDAVSLDSTIETDEPVEWVVRKFRRGNVKKNPAIQTAGLAPGFATPPARFPFVVDNISGAISELIFFYLYEKHYVENAKVFVENKLSSYAFDCKDWLAFLDAFGIVWHQATVDDLESYIGVMNAAISPTSGEEYRNATARRRVSTVEGLYKWARDARVYEGALPLKALLLPTVREGSDGGEKARRRVSVSTTAEEDEPIRVMEIEQARSIMNALGPLPTELLHGNLECHFNSAEEAIVGLGLNMRTSRDRLAGEFGLNSGLRVSEIRDLNVEKFTKFKSQSLVSNRNYKIRIVGKGRKPRLIDVPGWLINETLIYMKYERSLIVTSVGFATEEQAFF